MRRPHASPRIRARGATPGGALAAAVGAVLALAVTAVALRLADADFESAKRDRQAARAAVVTSTGRSMEVYLDVATAAAQVRAAPLSPADPVVDPQLLAQVRGVMGTDSVVVSALVAPDGRTLASLPAGPPVDVGALGAAWDRARAGVAARSNLFRYGNDSATAVLLPVGNEDPWAVLVIVDRSVTSFLQDYVREFGSLGDQPGGLVLLDRRGTVVNSWNEADIGSSLLDADEVAALPTGSAVVGTRQRNGVDTTTIATRVHEGYAVVFEQETGRMYGDLGEMQHQHTRTLLVVLAGTLVALAGFYVVRERGARRARARLRALLRDSRDLVVVTDGTGRVRFMSPAVEGLLGHTPESWVGQSLMELCHPEDAERLLGLLSRPGGPPELDVRMLGGDGGEHWFDVEASDLTGHHGVGGVLLTGHETGRRKDLADELAFLAHHDALTGLPNRERFASRLDALVEDGRPVRPFAVIYLDLDHFKPVNDTLGHDAGDHVLATVGQRLAEAARPGDLACRFGGDEFGVLVIDANADTARSVADRLLEAVRRPVAVSATLAHVDASVGIVAAGVDDVVGNPEAITRRADQAMYEAKRSGRGRCIGVGAPGPDAGTGPAAPPAATRGDGRGPGPMDLRDPTDGTGGRRPDPGAAGTGPVAVTGHGPGRSRPRRARTGRAAAPLAAAGVVVVALASVGAVQSARTLEAAETQRVAEKGTEAVHAAAFLTRLLDPQAMAPMGSAPPWTLDGSPLDQAIVAGMQQSPLAGEGGSALLVSTDGHVLAAAPADLPLAIATGSTPWRRVTAGRAVTVMNVADADQARNYILLPVVRDGATAAVVALGSSTRTGMMQQGSEISGSVGSDVGGWSFVNAEGVVVGSWSRDLVGTRLVDRTLLAPLAPGQTRVGTTLTGDVLVMAQMGEGGAEADFFAFTMPASVLFHDLRAGHTTRDLTLLLVVVAAVACLAAVNHRREVDDRRRREQLDALLEHGHDVTIVLDGTRATFVSSAVHPLLGYEPDDVRDADMLDWVHPEDRARVARLAATPDQRTASAEDVRVRTADGTYRWFDLDVTDLRDHPEVRGVLVLGHEVSTRKALQDELAFQARHDPLTGLPNRASLAGHLEAVTERDPAEQFAVLFVDLDHFKPVNDRLGHDAGDEVLRVIAGRLHGAVRTGARGDRSADVVCRWGGDEFAILLHDIEEADVRGVADRVLDAAREPIAVAGTVVELGATIGISLSHHDQRDPDVALRDADQAMYRAKDAGRGRYVLSGPEGTPVLP